MKPRYAGFLALAILALVLAVFPWLGDLFEIGFLETTSCGWRSAQ
jgi:hypothetical protein